MRLLRLIVLSLLTLPVFFAPPAAAADIELSTDAKGALFSVGQLTTSYEGTRCVEVEWEGNLVPRVLGVAAQVTGSLAPYLVLQIEAGTGGGYASCDGFRGDVIFRGSLEEFGVAHPNAASQLTARRFTGDAGAATFRVTASILDVNEAQSQSATAEFVFAALDESRLPDKPTAPVDETGPVVPTSPTSGGQPTKNGGQVTTGTGTSGESVTSGVTGTSGDPRSSGDPIRRNGNLAGDDLERIGREAGPSVAVPLTPKEEVPGLLATPIRALKDLLHGASELAQEAATPVVKGVAYSAWTLPMLLAFMLLQNYFDARDPKLSQAPVFASPSLPFDDGYGASGVVEGQR